MLSKSDSGYVLSRSKKIKAVEMLGNKCTKCNNDNLICLDFHHLNDKEDSINDILHKRWSEISTEIKKCILLCRNCHMEKHYPEASKLKIEILLKVGKPIQCETCGYDKNYASLDFHHTDQKTKKFSFRDVHNDHIFLRPINEIIEELSKCKLLCRNCHSIEHYDIPRFTRLKNEIYKKVKSYVEYNPVSHLDIIRMKIDGMKNIEISRQLGCSKSLVTYVINKNFSTL